MVFAITDILCCILLGQLFAFLLIKYKHKDFSKVVLYIDLLVSIKTLQNNHPNYPLMIDIFNTSLHILVNFCVI